MQFLFLWSMLGKFLGFGRMHENKIFFIFFLFLKREINLKVFEIFFKMFWIFFWNISKKTVYFNTWFVIYNVNIQPDIMQNW